MLITQADIPTFLPGLSDADTALVTALLAPVDRLVKDVVGYEIEYRTGIVEYQPPVNYHAPQDPLISGYELQGGRATPVEQFADEQRHITLLQLPVRSVESVYEDPNAWLQSTQPVFQTPVPPIDYSFDQETPGFSFTGFLLRHSGIWTNIERSIKVTYTAGLTADELKNTYTEYRMAALVTLMTWLAQFKQMRGGIKSAAAGPVVSQTIDGITEAKDAQTQSQLFGFQRKMPPAAFQFIEHRLNYARKI